MQKKLFFFKLVFILMFSFSAFASDAKADGKKETNQEINNKSTEKKHKNFFIHYKPPAGRSMPVNREGGGTRGAEDDEQYLAALVPNHVALTTKSQPSLFWYISTPETTLIEVTVNNETSFEPILETAVNKPEKTGIQRLSLADYNISLLPGIEYQWFITIVPDPEQRSKDISVTGMIKYIEPPKVLTEKLALASGIEIPTIYADEGLWYDTLLSISELIDANPKDKSLLKERIALFEQVGLNAVVD